MRGYLGAIVGGASGTNNYVAVFLDPVWSGVGDGRVGSGDCNNGVGVDVPEDGVFESCVLVGSRSCAVFGCVTPSMKAGFRRSVETVVGSSFIFILKTEYESRSSTSYRPSKGCSKDFFPPPCFRNTCVHVCRSFVRKGPAFAVMCGWNGPKLTHASS